VQGHKFDSSVVAQVVNLEPVEVEERLQALDRVHGLVRWVREAEFPDRTVTQQYAFVHILYQQTLVADLPPTRRATLASALGRTIEAHHGAQNPASAATLAYLYEVGRDFPRAAHQYWRAAQNAARLFGHQEAIALARRGLGLLPTLLESPERDALELPLQTILGLQFQVTKGYAAPEAGHAYHRARELCMRTSEGRLPFLVLWGLWLFCKVRSELTRARELAEELHVRAQERNDHSLMLQAQQALTVTSLCRGEPAAAVRHMAQGAALYDRHRHEAHFSVFGQDPGVACKAIGAVALWLHGAPESALRQSDEALELSHELSEPTSQTLALHFAAMLHQCRGDAERTRVCAELSGALAAEHGFSFWRAGAALLIGWAQASSGAVDEGLSRLRQGLRDWQATGSLTYRTYYLGLLADALTAKEQFEEARHTLDTALAVALQTGEGLYEAELHRLRGELTLRGDAGPEQWSKANADFHRALELARSREANALELRAALSLARLSDRHGSRAEAQRLLTEALGRFTEGFQTPDLQAAVAALAALS
jgi:predicted ATPase